MRRALRYALVGGSHGALGLPKRLPLTCSLPVPQFYLTPAVVCLMGGLLPFGSIFIEMYFIFTSFWNYKVHGLPPPPLNPRTPSCL